jgi:ribonuclease PH
LRQNPDVASVISASHGPPRPDGRGPLDLRPVTIVCDAVSHAEGSCLVTQGRTQVLVTASVEAKVPPFLQKTGLGWVTAEYGMLPRATLERSPREAARGKQSGRTLEIQRLIGRALRGVVDRSRLADRTLTLDCDVLVADAGTRCASVTGAYVALALACAALAKTGDIRANPLREAVAAVSLGLQQGRVLLDLDYAEDSAADVDLNVVGTSSGRFVEIQGTAEREPFDEEQLARLLAAGRKGLAALFAAQRAALVGRLPEDWLDALAPSAPAARRAQASAKKSRSVVARRGGSSRRA